MNHTILSSSFLSRVLMGIIFSCSLVQATEGDKQKAQAAQPLLELFSHKAQHAAEKVLSAAVSPLGLTCIACGGICSALYMAYQRSLIGQLYTELGELKKKVDGIVTTQGQHTNEFVAIKATQQQHTTLLTATQGGVAQNTGLLEALRAQVGDVDTQVKVIANDQGVMSIAILGCSHKVDGMSAKMERNHRETTATLARIEAGVKRFNPESSRVSSPRSLSPHSQASSSSLRGGLAGLFGGITVPVKSLPLLRKESEE